MQEKVIVVQERFEIVLDEEELWSPDDPAQMPGPPDGGMAA